MMRTGLHSWLWLALGLLVAIPTARSASNPGPENAEEMPTPAPEFAQLHLLQLELSWDFGNAGPDWRKELTGDDPTAEFLLRWKHSGPNVATAKLSVYDSNDAWMGELPLPLDLPARDGWRYQSYQVGDLPSSPTFTARVRLSTANGKQAGSASPEVQMSMPSLVDPFLYTVLFIRGIVIDTGVPGIAGGVVCGEQGGFEERRFFSGVRKFDGGAGPVGPNDCWHWGSITKSMTSTLLGILIEEGVQRPDNGQPVTWNTPLSGIFPEYVPGMHPRFAGTTLRHLACHRSGIYTNDIECALAHKRESEADPVEMRRQIVASVMRRQHVDPGTGVATPVGVTWRYANEGYFILGAVIERLSGTRYEALMQLRLFDPLGMAHTGWGVPPEFSYYQPHGHQRLTVYPYTPYVNDIELFPPQAPAGALYCPIEDMLKYCRLHLYGSEGSLSLSEATRQELHTPYPQQPPGDESYALGWIANEDGSVVGHNGTIGTYYAYISIDKTRGVTAAAAINAGFGWSAVNLLHAHLVEKALALCSGTPVFGSFEGPNGGSSGIQEAAKPPVSFTSDTPLTTEGEMLPSGFFPVSLYLSDVVGRGVQAANRAPVVLSFDRLSARTFELRFRSEPGARYEQWDLGDLRPNSAHRVREVDASTNETSLDISRPVSERRAFFQIRDLFTE